MRNKSYSAIIINMEKLKALFRKMNDLGIPMPMLRDPKTGKASVTLTMMMLSFNTALLGQLGKVTKVLGDVDMTSAIVLFTTTAGLYLGRKMQSNGKETTIEPNNADNQQEGK